MYRRHDYKPKQKDPTALPLRILCGLLGVTFGFAAGRIYGPDNLLPEELTLKKEVKTAPREPAAGLGAPVGERLQGVLRMDRDMLAATLAAIQQEWERDTSGPAGREQTEMHLRTLFSRWVELDGAGALRSSLAIKDRNLSRMAVLGVYHEWARRSPSEAIQTLTGLQQLSLQRAAGETIARAGVPRDPVVMLGLVSKIPAAPQTQLTAAIGAEWMRLDASHALRRLLEERIFHPAQPAGMALARWMLEDPSGWMQWRRGNQSLADAAPLLRLEPSAFTAGRLTSLGDALQSAFGSADAGRDWLMKAAGSDAAQALAAILPPAAFADAVMQAWQAGEEKRAPFSSVTGWLASESHTTVLQAIARRFSEHDAPAALSWAAKLPRTASISATSEIAAGWLADAPASAPGKLFTSDMSTPAGRAAAAAAIEQLIRSDPAKALENLPGLKLEPALHQSFQINALQQLSRVAPEKFLEWLAAHPEMKPPAGPVSAALKSVALSSPERAIQFARSRSSADTLPQESAAIISIWLTRDRAGAMDYLRALPDGPERDACTTALTAADLAMNDPFFAANILPESFEAALRLRDTATRQSSLRSIFARMKLLKVPVQAVLALPGLNPADRDALNKS